MGFNSPTTKFSMLIIFFFILSILTLSVAVAPKGPWDSFNYAPQSRTVRPRSVRESFGSVRGAQKLASENGVATLKGTGVRINCISAGQIDIGVDLQQLDKRGNAHQLPPSSLQSKEHHKQIIGLERPGLPTEIARVAQSGRRDQIDPDHNGPYNGVGMGNNCINNPVPVASPVIQPSLPTGPE